jgi:hypothetical protein
MITGMKNMDVTANIARNLKVLALIGTAFCATSASAQNTVITADKMIDVPVSYTHLRAHETN